MTGGTGNVLSRRNLLSDAVKLGAAAMVAPLLARPMTSLAHTPEAAPSDLEAVLQAGLDAGLTGVALRVERGDEILFDGAAGFASVERGTLLTPADRIRIASVTKAFTAVVVMQLVEEGILALDDTVGQRLEDPVVGRIPNVDRMTVRQLLNHTGGVYDYFDEDSPFWQDAYFGDGVDWTRVWTPDELLGYADGDKHAPYFAPGEGFHYTNTGYILLGLILEQATGRSCAEELHERVLDPLGLTDTFYAATEPVLGGTADVYHMVEGEAVNVSATHLSALGAGGGMVSTTRDLAQFANALLGGELLRQETMSAMLTFVPTIWPGAEWGLGVMRVERPFGPIIGHEGDGPGCEARMFRLDDENMTLVLLTNTGGADDIASSLFDQAIQAAAGSVAPAA